MKAVNKLERELHKVANMYNKNVDQDIIKSYVPLLARMPSTVIAGFIGDYLYKGGECGANLPSATDIPNIRRVLHAGDF